MKSIAEILNSLFHDDPCDFCPASGRTYTDPETGCRYCLECLVLSTIPLEDGPPDPAIMVIAREVIAARRAAASA